MKNNDASLTGNLFVTILLISILVTLILILQRMPSSPPTVGEIRQAKGKERTLMKNSIPVVRVNGGNIDSTIYDTIDVRVTNEVGISQPIQVEVYQRR